MKYKLYEYAYENFKNYISENFDERDPKIENKLNHTYHVVENVKYICNEMDVDNENTDLAMLIALLHDIGRFYQAREMKSFREDITNYDHATLGVKLLFEQNEIRYFIKDNKYDNIIKLAIGNHSKYILETEKLNDIELLHSNIIRDADKIDSYRAKTVDDIYTMANITSDDIEESYISDKIYNDFMNHKTILSKDRKTGIDMWVSYIAFAYGLEFKSSYKKIKENDYVNKLFNRFKYKLDNEKMLELREEILKYIDIKLNN